MLASRICCCTQVETSHVTEQRYCKTNLVVSVLPAPLSPEMTHDCKWNESISIRQSNDNNLFSFIDVSPKKVNESLINPHLIFIVVNNVSVSCLSKGKHMRLQQSQFLSMIFMHMILMNGRRNKRILIMDFSFFFFSRS